MSYAIPAPVLSPDSSEIHWHALYLTAAIAALITVALFLFQILAFFIWPPPATVAGHFALLQSRPIVGLICLDFLIIVDEVLAIPLFLALYVSLRRVHESLMLDRHRPLGGVRRLLPYRYACPEHAVPQPAICHGRHRCGTRRASCCRSCCAVVLAGNSVSGGQCGRINWYGAHRVGDAAQLRIR